MTEAIERGPRPESGETAKRVYDVIGDLDARRVAPRDLADLRKAADRAAQPIAGRAGQDAAIGKISRG